MTRTDDEIVADIDKKIMELNSLLGEAGNSQIEIQIKLYPYFMPSSGELLFNSSMSFEARKIKKLMSKFVTTTGGR